MIPMLLPLLLLSLSLLLLPLLPPSLPLLPLGNRYCCSQQEGGNTTPLKVRTVSPISASIPLERWNCDTTLILLGVEGLLFVFILVI